MKIPPSRINTALPQCISVPFPLSCPWWDQSLGSYTHASQSILGPSDRQKPGALCWAVGGRRPLASCGWLIGVVRVFTEVWGLILGVDWQVNIQRVQMYRWNVKGPAKGFFICWWRLEWNMTKEKLRDISKGELPDLRHKDQFTSHARVLFNLWNGLCSITIVELTGGALGLNNPDDVIRVISGRAWRQHISNRKAVLQTGGKEGKPHKRNRENLMKKDMI